MVEMNHNGLYAKQNLTERYICFEHSRLTDILRHADVSRPTAVVTNKDNDIYIMDYPFFSF